MLKTYKPLLVGGIGLSFSLAAWWLLRDSLIPLGEWGLIIMMVFAAGLWRFPKGLKKSSLFSSSPLSLKDVQGAIDRTQKLFQQLETEDPQITSNPTFYQLQGSIEHLPNLLQRSTLKGAITGGKFSGKTTLKQVLEAFNFPELSWEETPPLSSGKETQEHQVGSLLKEVDLVVWITETDLTDSQLQILQDLKSAKQRILLAFNKQDCYIPEERSIILNQLKGRVNGLISPEDIFSISASPSPIKVQKHQNDGTFKEYWEGQKPDVSPLRDRLALILSQEKQALIWGGAWRSTLHLQTQIQQQLNLIRRDKALPIVEKYQWVAGAAAFANPVAALDLLATAAISAQLLMDLGEVYQQKFSVSHAKSSARTIGQLIVKLGLVELSTQAIGSFLKSHAITYIAGGTVQGLSAAYLTRIAGLSLIEYFQEQALQMEPNQTAEGLNFDKIGEKLKVVFEQNQRTAFLQGFVKKGINILSLQQG